MRFLGARDEFGVCDEFGVWRVESFGWSQVLGRVLRLNCELRILNCEYSRRDLSNVLIDCMGRQDAIKLGEKRGSTRFVRPSFCR